MTLRLFLGVLTVCVAVVSLNLPINVAEAAVSVPTPTVSPTSGEATTKAPKACPESGLNAAVVQTGQAVKMNWFGMIDTESDSFLTTLLEDIENELSENSVIGFFFPNLNLAGIYNKQAATGAAAPMADRVAVANGAWSSGATWGGSVPTASQTVYIPSGKTVTIDGDAVAKNVHIAGVLKANRTANSSLTTHWVMVMGAGARFEVGTPTLPLVPSFTLELIGTDVAENIEGAGTKFLMAMDGGEIQMHGTPQVSWTKLAATVEAGASTIVLSDSVGWNVGDQIVIAPSTAPRMTDPALATEVRTIVAKSKDCATLTLNQPLTYRHIGVQKSYTNGLKTWILDQRAEVGLLSRNIKVRGDDASTAEGFGGHIMMMNCPKDGKCTPGKGYFSNIELARMGQKPQPKKGFAGLGRYPIHWHLLQGAGDGQYIKSSSIHNTFNRGLTIHGTEKLLIEGNVFYNTIGHTIFLEDGSERFNKFYNNLVLDMRTPVAGEELLPSDNQIDGKVHSPAMFWITNPNNEFVGNVAAGSQGVGYWFIFPKTPHGLSMTLPYFAGLKPNEEPLGVFRGNVVHSTADGISVSNGITPGSEVISQGGWKPKVDGYFDDSTVYAIDQRGIYVGSANGPELPGLRFRSLKSADIGNAGIDQSHVFFVGYGSAEDSLFVADSGNGVRQPKGNNLVSLYTMYAGNFGRITNSHIVGFDQPGTTFLRNLAPVPEADEKPNTFAGLTFDPPTRPRIVLTDCSSGVCDPIASRMYMRVLDEDGSLTGMRGASIIENHPMLIVPGSVPWTNPATGSNAYISPHAYKMIETATKLPVIWTRTGGGLPTATYTDAKMPIFSTRRMLVLDGGGFHYATTTYNPYSVKQSLTGTLPTERAPHGQGNVFAPDVMLDGGVYKMWYAGQGKDGKVRIHYATSLNGMTGWNKAGVVLDGEGASVSDPSVVKVDASYRMYYTSSTTSGYPEVWTATSNDGMVWTGHQKALTTDTDKLMYWNKKGSSNPSVIYDGKIYQMWFYGVGVDNKGYIGYVTSADGTTWSLFEKDPVGSPNAGVSVRKWNDKYFWTTQRNGEGSTAIARGRKENRFSLSNTLINKSDGDLDRYGQADPTMVVSADNKPIRVYFAAQPKRDKEHGIISYTNMLGTEFDQIFR